MISVMDSHIRSHMVILGCAHDHRSSDKVSFQDPRNEGAPKHLSPPEACMPTADPKDQELKEPCASAGGRNGETMFCPLPSSPSGSSCWPACRTGRALRLCHASRGDRERGQALTQAGRTSSVHGQGWRPSICGAKSWDLLRR